VKHFAPAIRRRQALARRKLNRRAFTAYFSFSNLEPETPRARFFL
jgi:hypothetical protein